MKTAFIKTLPVMAGYIVLGFGFGIISEKNGYGILWILAMSSLIYAGSMQYVAVSLLTSGATLIAFNTAGVEFAMTALFITVFVEQWKSTKNHIPAMLIISNILILGRNIIEKKGD